MNNLEAKKETTTFKLKKILPKTTKHAKTWDNTKEVLIDMSQINPGNVDRASHYFKQLQKW